MEIQEAIQKIKELESSNNILAIEIYNSGNEADKLKVQSKHEEFEKNKEEILRLHNQFGIGYVVFECIWNGDTLDSQSAVSTNFDTIGEAQSFMISNFKGNETEEKKYHVFPSTLGGNGEYIAHH